jgi:hypothetical protein
MQALRRHECDLLICRSSHCIEVEIKTSRSDLARDLKKCHGHRSDIVRQLYFAIPTSLKQCLHLIPDHAGVLCVEISRYGYYKVKCLRSARINRSARALTQAEKFNLARLGAMRIWTLKAALERERQHRPEYSIRRA